MNKRFLPNERLYPAILPPELAAMYRKRDGSLSYTAFMDPRGLSVDRGYYRTDEEVSADMKKRLNGIIVRFYVRTCTEIGAHIRYLPSKNDPYHTEIHGSEDTLLLSRHQCFYLAKRAKKVK